MKEYIVNKGKHAARPLILKPEFGKLPSAAWKVQLGKGWDYELPRNRLQWVKICGHTFNPVNRNKNSVMLAARRNKDKIELAPYYNINGESWYKGGGSDAPKEVQVTWPVVEIDLGSKEVITFFYFAQKGKIYSGIITDNEMKEKGHKILHPGIGCIQYEVNFWFGGSEKAPQDVSIFKQKTKVPHWIKK